MTFDYFNTSNLAFGKKLTQAFQTLNDLMSTAENNVDYAIENIINSDLTKNLNYSAPVPTSKTLPVRSAEMFNIVNGYDGFKQLEYKNGLLSVEYILYNPITAKITLATGSTELKEGYAFLKYAISNESMQQPIRFSDKSDIKDNEILFFKFRITQNNKINISGDIQNNIKYYPYDATQYRALEHGSAIPNPYTAKDYECICLTGSNHNIKVNIDGVTKLSCVKTGYHGGTFDYNHCIVYLKPNQVLSGVYNNAFRIDYKY